MAAESTTASVAAVPLITVFIGVFGPAIGPYLLILFGAVCGCFWALASAESMTRWQVIKMAIRVIMLSALLTVAVSELLHTAFGWGVSELYVVVSISIAAMGDKWLGVIESLSEALKTAMTGMFKPKDKAP